MQQYKKTLGKVMITPEGAWRNNKDYDILSVVNDNSTDRCYISKCYVPIGVTLDNSEYWMPLNVAGYSDTNFMIISKKRADGQLESFTIETAIASIAEVNRKVGCIICFFNNNTDRLDIGGSWEIWQFNDTNLYNWNDVNSWVNIYYNYNKFVGWFANEAKLKTRYKYPHVGMYAYVGTRLNEAVVYRCDVENIWSKTSETAKDYVKVIVKGNVSIGENGNWFVDGIDTCIPASIKGDNGKTPYFRNNANKLEYSYDEITWYEISDYLAHYYRYHNNKLQHSNDNIIWEDVSDYISAWFRWSSDNKIQISRDGYTWSDLSNVFSNNLHISRYIGIDETLPTSGIAEGTIYAKGPTYADGDTSHANPIYRLWVYAWKGNTLAWVDNGEFTSIAAGVVQETGDNENVVMSQKAVTENINILTSNITTNSNAINVINSDGSPIIIPGIKTEDTAFSDNEINGNITFVENRYRNIIKYDIRGFNGILEIKNCCPMGNLIGAITTDENGNILDMNYVYDTNPRDIHININKYQNASFIYISELNNVEKYSSNALYPIIDIYNSNRTILASNITLGVKSKTIPLFKYHSYTTNEPVVGEKLNTIYDRHRSNYRGIIKDYVGCKIIIEKSNPAEYSKGVIILDKRDNILAIYETNIGVESDTSIDLNNYPNAVYIIVTGTEPTITAERISQNLNYIDGYNNILEYSSLSGVLIDASLSIGDKFSTTENRYRRLISINVENLKDKLKITNILSSGSKKDVAIVDKEGIILDLLSNSDNNSYVENMIVDLDKYSGKAAMVYATVAPESQTQYNQPIITNFYEGIRPQLKSLEKVVTNKGVLLLHFDANPTSLNDRRVEIIKEYGFNVSWCLSRGSFTDLTFAEWTSDEARNTYEELIKRGDDFGLYPAMRSDALDEQGWNEWLDIALFNLAKHNIHNITTFCCGQLAINDSLYNAVKSHGFKIIRGGNTVIDGNTYEYSENNRYMTLNPTNNNFFVNDTKMIGNNARLDQLIGNINYAIDSHTAVSLFAHNIVDDDSSTNHVTEAKLRIVLDAVKEKVDAGKLEVMTWREYYRSVNIQDGAEWDYNRLIKMIM